jgi:hypothetical protein
VGFADLAKAESQRDLGEIYKEYPEAGEKWWPIMGGPGNSIESGFYAAEPANLNLISNVDWYHNFSDVFDIYSDCWYFPPGVIPNSRK